MSNTACAKGSALVSIHCLSSKENEENTRQAMTINGALPLGGEQGGTAVKETAVKGKHQ
jgi:hypothetical protein